jgi:octaprenyl-diphosphate synthase
MLTLAAAQMFGYEGEGHIRLATAVEFMHTATLLHDDVVDESGMRRGKKTARMIWGNQASVLVGDFLLGQAFRMMVEVGSLEALDILSTAASIIAEGEVMQLAAAKNLDTTEDEPSSRQRRRRCSRLPRRWGRSSPGRHAPTARRCAPTA